jgi:hypothetical protein
MRTIPDPRFADDDGSVDPALRSALDSFAADRRTGPVLVAMSAARLLVPVVATVGETAPGEQGLTVDKSADVAAVLMTGRDGRRALLAFTGVDPLACSSLPPPLDRRTPPRSWSTSPARFPSCSKVTTWYASQPVTSSCRSPEVTRGGRAPLTLSLRTDSVTRAALGRGLGVGDVRCSSTGC